MGPIKASVVSLSAISSSSNNVQIVSSFVSLLRRPGGTAKEIQFEIFTSEIPATAGASCSLLRTTSAVVRTSTCFFLWTTTSKQHYRSDLHHNSGRIDNFKSWVGTGAFTNPQIKQTGQTAKEPRIRWAGHLLFVPSRWPAAENCLHHQIWRAKYGIQRAVEIPECWTD